jgi:hypothetical protein
MIDRIREMTLILTVQLALLVVSIYPVTITYELAGVCLLLLGLNLLVTIVCLLRLRVFLSGLIGAHLRGMLLPLLISLVSFIGPKMMFEIFFDGFSIVSFTSLATASLALYASLMLLLNRHIINEMRSFYASVISSGG